MAATIMSSALRGRPVALVPSALPKRGLPSRQTKGCDLRRVTAAPPCLQPSFESSSLFTRRLLEYFSVYRGDSERRDEQITVKLFSHPCQQ